MKKLWRFLVLAFWKLVFWWKHRTGFLDLGQDVTITGTVVSVDGLGEPSPDNDGDFCFNVRPDPEYGWVNTAFGGRKTSNDSTYLDTIHCEVPPWLTDGLKAQTDLVVPGVGGSMWKEVWLALWRHQPNVLDGWCELHPVTRIDLL